MIQTSEQTEKEIAAKLEHRQRHRILHAVLDELVADYLAHNRNARPSSSSVMDLMQWSKAQTIHPTEL